MAKVQFNCRLEETVRDRIVALAVGRSQADVVAAAVAALDMETAQGRIPTSSQIPSTLEESGSKASNISDPAEIPGVQTGAANLGRRETGFERAKREVAEREAGARARSSVGDDPSYTFDPEFVQE